MARLTKGPYASSRPVSLPGLIGQRRGASRVLRVTKLQVANVPVRNCRVTGVQGPPKLPMMVNYEERGKAVCPPCAIHGKPTARQAHEGAVVRTWKMQKPLCNGVDRGCNIISRESGQTSIWSYVTRKVGKSSKEEKQMAVMKSLAMTDNLRNPNPSTASSIAGASSPTGDGWHDIEWPKVHQNVRRLQARIVKATQEKRWGKVKALQRLLTRSFSGKALAVKRVTENQGKRTPGVDGVIWSSPNDKIQAIHAMRQHGYRAQPLRRIYIPKSNGKGKRPLSIPVMADRAFQALYLLALDPISETTGDANSYGFRKERSPADALQQCFTVLSQKTSAQWILEGDIKSCFDEIDRKWLQRHIPLEKPIFNQWLLAGYLDQQQHFPTEAGVPQGGGISPFVANLTLDGLEALLRQRFPRHRGHKVNLVRFADDFVRHEARYVHGARAPTADRRAVSPSP